MTNNDFTNLLLFFACFFFYRKNKIWQTNLKTYPSLPLTNVKALLNCEDDCSNNSEVTDLIRSEGQWFKMAAIPFKWTIKGMNEWLRPNVRMTLSSSHIKGQDKLSWKAIPACISAKAIELLKFEETFFATVQLFFCRYLDTKSSMEWQIHQMLSPCTSSRGGNKGGSN